MFVNRNKQHCSQKSCYFFFVLILSLLCAPLALSAQQKHALLIGISNYPEYDYADASWAPIHGTNDVQLIAPILTEQGFVINTLTNEAATRQAIDNSFKELESRVKAGNIVYIHLSGHGQVVEDVDGDEDDGWDEAFIPYDAERSYREDGYHGENHLLDDELNRYLISIRRKAGTTGIVYVAMDACHAGFSYRGEEEQDSVYVRGTEIGFSKTGKTYAPRINRSGNVRIDTEKGMAPIFMLESCRSYEVNLEIKQDGNYYGPMSYYISQQLLTSSLSFDINWIEQVQKCMKKDKRLKDRQHMVIESSE